MDKIRTAIVRALLGEVSGRIGILEELLEENFKQLKARQVECFSLSAYHTLKPCLYNFFYYKLCGKGDFCIFQSDYDALTDKEEEGICYPEPSGGRFNLLRLVRIMKSEKNNAALLQKMNVRLRRGVNTVFVDGVEYPLLMEVPDEARRGVHDFLSAAIDPETCSNKCEELAATLKEWPQTAGLSEHLFLSEQDKREVQRGLKELRKRLDACRINIQKLSRPLDEQ